MTSAIGVNFAECLKSKVKIKIDGISIDFIEIESLKTNKLATSRLQDLGDVEKLGRNEGINESHDES